MDGVWLIVAIFLFAFVLWVSTGGPTRPISFSGPYITPITDVGDVQEAYGPDLDPDGPAAPRSSFWSVRSIFGRFEGRLSSDEIGVVSPLQGNVEIVSGAGGPSGKDPDSEYVTIRATSEDSVDITGWRLVSARSGAEAFIPQGTLAPRRSGVLANIVLAPGEEAIVTTGESPVGNSFRENKCVGYLDRGSFVPPLSTRNCPTPSEELGDFYGGSAASYDACREHVARLPRCEAIRDIPREASRDCEAFMESRLNYEGCVTGHFNDEDFRGKTWRVYLNRSRELWRSDKEIIKLLDTQGRTVDIYSY